MNYTNDMNLPQPFVDAVKSNHVYKPKRYSVTEILGGTCEAILKRRHDSEMTDDISRRIWALFGTAVHEVLRRGKPTESQMQEKWFCVDVPVGEETYQLSGILDLYDADTETVTDWKTTSVWTVKFGDFDKWRMQTLAYCYMLMASGYKATHGKVVAILRDHNMRKAKVERDYPEHPVFRTGWDFTAKDLSDMGSYIGEWFLEVSMQEKLPDDELEPCSSEQRWHKDDKWAVKKKGRKTAIRVYTKKQDAYQRAAGENREAGKKDLFYVEERPGEDTKCESYCSVAEFCPYYQALMKPKEEPES